MKTYGDFPEIIREVLKIRVGAKYNHGTKSTANTRGDGFEWEDSPEGFDFWAEVLDKGEHQAFFDKYPLSPSLYPCNQHDKCIASVDIAFEGVDIKRGTIIKNSLGHLLHRLCDYNRYMKQFNLNPQQEENPFNIDYSKSDWWKILEEGDEVIVVGSTSTLGVEWERLQIGTILKVTNKDVRDIGTGDHLVCFDTNRCIVNFTYNMVKLHKKKNKQSHNFHTHESDLSTDSGTIGQPVGTGSISVPGSKCQIANSSRLAGTAKSIVPSPPTIKSGVLSSVQLVKHY